MKFYTYPQILFALLMLSGVNAGAQSTTVSLKGFITSSDGKPAAGVTVSLKEISKSTSTNESGAYQLTNIKPAAYTVTVSFIGLRSQEQTVDIRQNETAEANFVLKENASQLAEVIITASRSANEKAIELGKSNIRAMDMPQSVQVIGSQVITDQQANRLSDVLKNVNGVAYGENRGSVSGETFFARGYSLGTNNVMKNGVRANSGGMPETSTLESVEVLKGSAALLYGGVTGGAVVNMVTKKPKFNYGGEISMRAGSYDLYKPVGDVYGPVTKNLAFRLIGTYENAASFRNNVKADRTYINPSLLYKLGKRTEVLLQGDYLKSDYTPDFGIGSIGNKIVDIGRGAFLNTLWAYNKTNTTTSQINVNHNIDDNWKLNAVVSLQSYNRNYFSSERPAAAANGDWTRLLTRSKTKEFTYNQQLNFSGRLKTGSIGHTLLIGADADQSDVTSYGFVYGTGSNNYGTINLYNPSTYNTRTDMPETSIVSDTRTPIYRMGTFIQDLVSLTDKFKILAGVRYTFQKTPRTITTNYASGAVTLSNNSLNRSKLENVFSPKFGLIYQPYRSTSVYVSYANNFTSNTGTDIYMAPLDPSVIDQYEAGIKNDFFNGKLSANVTWYKIINDKFAQTALLKADGTPNADATIKEFNGSTASDGLEIDLSGPVVRGMTFLAGYSYNFYRYTHTLDKTGITEGERIVGTTKNTANGTLFYTFSAGQMRGLKLGASAYYTGDRNGGYNTRKTPNPAQALIPLKAFTTFDLSAGYAFKKLSVLGKISNITDEVNYFVHENYSVNPIPPRQFITTVSYKF